MSYSLDLRQKVINYIENGGKITEAAKKFGVGRATIYKWLNRQNLEATQGKRMLYLEGFPSQHFKICQVFILSTLNPCPVSISTIRCVFPSNSPDSF